MAARAPGFDLSILDAHIVARRVGRRRASERAAITHAEARAVPGALHNIAFQRAFVQRPAGVRTGSGYGVDMQTLAQQHHRNACYQNAIELVFLDLFNRHDRFKTIAPCFPGRMIDVGAFYEDHIATEIGGITHYAQPNKANYGGGNAIATGLGETQHQRDNIQHQRARIEDGVIKADTALGAVGIAPIGETGTGRTQRAEDTKNDGGLRPASSPGKVDRRDEPNKVKDCCNYPGPDRNICQHRVQRMTEPGAVEETLKAARWLAISADQDANNMLQLIAQTFREWLRGRFIRRRGFGGGITR